MTITMSNSSKGNGVNHLQNDFEASITPTEESWSSYRSPFRKRANEVTYTAPPTHVKKKSFNVNFIAGKTPIDPETFKMLDKAYELIVDTLDLSYNIVERSNLFDEWRSLLKHLSRVAKSLSANHNAVLGSILVATNKKDIWDFDKTTLNVFREATYTLRQNDVYQSDVDRVINNLSEIQLAITWPIYDLNGSSFNVDNKFEMIKKELEK